MAAETEQQDTPERERAMIVAKRLCDIAFDGRKGHGQGPCSYRQMTREDLMAFLVTAFERGADWESRR